MFEPRPLLEYKAPVHQKHRTPTYTGVSQYANLFEKGPPPPKADFVPPAERKTQMKEKLLALHNEKNELLAADWDPNNNPKATE